MHKPFRTTSPQRTYQGKELTDYRKYKNQLRQDFHSRCGYTDCPDFWLGGPSSSEIDHFKPKSKYPHLTTAYANLVYSSSLVNRSKSNDYHDDLYLDPCQVDYNHHFYRDTYGNILPRKGSPAAHYMYKKMKLYLKRYGIIWMLDQLQMKIKKVHAAIDSVKEEEKKQKLLYLHYQLARSFQDYLDYLKLAH